MSVEFRGSQVRRELAEQVGRVLLRVAVLVQTAGKQRMNASNQHGRNPSRPGDWLHKGTGHGQAGLTYAPTTPAAIAAAGSVRVGWAAGSWYMGWWGLATTAARRKGLIDLVEELRPQLAALTGGR